MLQGNNWTCGSASGSDKHGCPSNSTLTEVCGRLALTFSNVGGQSWSESTEVCDWYGIACTYDRAHVTLICIPEDNNLDGHLVPLSLPLLQTLAILGNPKLKGELPSRFSELENLNKMYESTSFFPFMRMGT